MEELLRTQVGIFGIADSLRLAEIQRLTEEGGVDSVIHRVDSLFEHFTPLHVRPKFDKIVHNGNPVRHSQCRESEAETEQARIYDSQGHFIGIYRMDDRRGAYVPVKMFWENEG